MYIDPNRVKSDFIQYELYETVGKELRQAHKEKGKDGATKTKPINFDTLCEIHEKVKRYRELSKEVDKTPLFTLSPALTESYSIKVSICAYWWDDKHPAHPFMMEHWPEGPIKEVSRTAKVRATVRGLRRVSTQKFPF